MGFTAEEFRVLVLALVLGELALDTCLDILNLRAFAPQPPRILQGFLDPDRYAKARDYFSSQLRASLVRRAVSTMAFLAFFLASGFDALDRIAREFGSGRPWLQALGFVALLGFLQFLLRLPFAIHHTFVLEEKFGFNRTTPRTFVLDLFRALLLAALLGAPVFLGLVWFFETFGREGWLYAWSALLFFNLAVTYLAPVLILPLFNRYTPIPDGELKQAISSYAERERFQLQGVYVMDGSKRSAKSNAFFTGFGRFRRLALFDTLLTQQNTEEIMAVVAHEVGHFKRGHIPKFLAISILSTGVLLWIVSLFLKNPALFGAFQMSEISVYASLIFMGILYSPIARLLSIFPNKLSRKFEFEADEFSLKSFGKPEALVSALKKLSAENLSHPTPHSWKVAMDYTHPPVLTRIARLQSS